MNPEVAGTSVAPAGVIITRLAELPERTILDETALAAALDVDKRTVRKMVCRFELPPAVRMGGRSRWIVGHVLSWIEARAEKAAREAERTSQKLRDLP